jgi:hypothetical protein
MDKKIMEEKMVEENKEDINVTSGETTSGAASGETTSGDTTSGDTTSGDVTSDNVTNNDKSFIIRMPLEMHRKLKLVSYQTNLTMQDIVIDAIQHELYKYEKDIKELLNIFEKSK